MLRLEEEAVGITELSLAEIKRYSRQLILPGFGAREQRRLKKARVVVTGAGGVGSPLLPYLAAAGVGSITIIDNDTVEATNLNRQFLFNQADFGKNKAEAAAEKIRQFNPEIEVKAICETITYENVFELLKGYDAVVDGTDNFPARYAINDGAMKNRTALFHAAILQYEGRVISIIPGESACIRCAFPEIPPPGAVPTCREAGVLGATIGIVASIAALETIKYLAGLQVGLKNRLLLIDGRTLEFKQFVLERNENCSACGKKFVPQPVDVKCDVCSVDESVKIDVGD